MNMGVKEKGRKRKKERKAEGKRKTEFIPKQMASGALGKHRSPVVRFSEWFTGNRVTCALAHVKGSKRFLCSTGWLRQYTLRQRHIRRITEVQGHS